MAMEFNIENFVEFIAAISSLFIGSFFILISIFNQDIKAFIYLAGVFFTYIISGLVFSPFLKGFAPDITDRSFICDIVKFPMADTASEPALNSLFLGFTASYLATPMLLYDQLNYPLMMFFIFLLFFDGFYRAKYNCYSMLGILIGALIGVAGGIGWFYLLYAQGYESSLYFGETMSNNAVCTRPSSQKFRCDVYKNGQLVT